MGCVETVKHIMCYYYGGSQHQRRQCMRCCCWTRTRRRFAVLLSTRQGIRRPGSRRTQRRGSWRFVNVCVRECNCRNPTTASGTLQYVACISDSTISSRKQRRIQDHTFSNFFNFYIFGEWQIYVFMQVLVDVRFFVYKPKEERSRLRRSVSTWARSRVNS